MVGITVPAGVFYWEAKGLCRDGRYGNACMNDYLPSGQRLHELFEQTASLHGERIAVECNGRRVTYAQLNQQAQQLSQLLLAQGIGAGDCVGLLLPRGVDVYIALLGILKTGAAYVPLDGEYPAQRVSYILIDCKVAAVVTTRPLLPKCQGVDCQRVLMDELEHTHASPSAADAPPRRPSDSDLCYVIYTSGSTGMPKGVQIEHRSAVHLVEAEREIFGVTPDDRVYQGFSIAFDASVEEVWLAFRSGATLVAGTEEMVHAGPDLSRFLTDAGITVLSCVPTLLSMMHEDVPSVRLLIVGGESCPADLVRRWALPGRRMVNSYGPTEATVIATYGDVEPGKPVTIGRAVRGYDLRILDDQQRGVPAGQTGEICIGGIALARGYVGRDDLTRERFVPDPDGLLWERLYRTGDLGRWTELAEIEFLGRIDGQVKIRGFRVELSEIEAALIACEGVGGAAVAVHNDAAGVQQLVGYLVRGNGAAIDHDAVRARLRQRLPAYMIPSIFEEIVGLPTLTSGKVDRKSLPAPRPRTAPAKAVAHPPRSELERQIAVKWASAFGVAAVSVSDHFFTDLGGHSLLAATVVSSLRREPRFRAVSVVDIYNFPTVEKLAAELGHRESFAQPASPARPTATTPVPGWRYRLCAVAQALSLYPLFALFSLQWITPYLAYCQVLEATREPLYGLVACMVVLVALSPASLLLPVLAKWLLIGRYRAGDYPLWGWYYFRWWLVNRVDAMAPVAHLEGTPLLNAYYRLMGAKIGKDVHLGSDNLGMFDLISIGDGTTVSAESSLLGYTVQNGLLKLRPISVGTDCYIGTHAILAPGSKMEDGSGLGNLSMLPAGGRVPAGQNWIGSPARPTDHHYVLRPHVGRQANDLPEWVCMLWQIIGVLLVPPVYILAIFPGIYLMNDLYRLFGGQWYLLASPLAGIAFVLALCITIPWIKWVVLGDVKPGTHSLRSGFYLRKWFVDQLMSLSLEILGPLYATLYFNPWYRILGAKIGHRAEVSTAISTSPDLLEIADESFTADATSLGAAYVDRGRLTMQPVKIGRRAFIGNSALIPGGSVIGDDTLIGVLSTPPATSPGAAMPDSTWLGSPAIFLPQRQKAAGFDPKNTYQPTRALYAQRLFIEFFRIILPASCFAFLGCIMITTTMQLPATWPLWKLLAVFPLLCMACGFLAALIVIATKWLLMGRYKPMETPLWSGFVWRTELLTALHEHLADPFLVEMLEGTPFAAWFFRLMGARIGSRVFLETGNLTEFDLIEIGDDACINSDCTLQTHLFEDRVMKMSHIRIGKGCVIGADAVVLYDTRMEDGSQLGDLSLLMKGETLPAHTAWAGSPAQPIVAPAPASPARPIAQPQAAVPPIVRPVTVP